jgi:hypothetical protein
MYYGEFISLFAACLGKIGHTMRGGFAGWLYSLLSR